MQFVTNGPDIPDALLQAHEEGRVIFFCGAGVSYPAGLPDFRGLVERVYAGVGDRLRPIEEQAFNGYQYDATLNLLEDRLPGQRKGLQMRRALAKSLEPNLRKKGATETHAALLQLARDREGRLRLVTTNFDRVFERVAKRDSVRSVPHIAPMLPVPKNSRWDGLVYLHGLLPEKPDDNALNRLVVTSGDFGLAYLTERWAARFVSELFRNYVVCFVGYSINDPVMRYMMDALAADRVLGEITPQAWALGDAKPGEEAAKTIEWQAKGVTPILYEVSEGDRKHAALHATLKVWAETYRDGINGKSGIVTRHAMARPSGSTRQDDFVGRMLWALSDKSGAPAEKFADFNPAPSLEWLLEAFSEERFRQVDLPRFDVAPHPDEDGKLKFSLINRPTSYLRAPRMSLVVGSGAGGSWDYVMFHLARWLTRHLNDPNLLLWLAERGGRLGAPWTRLVEQKLEELARLEHEGKTSELTAILADAPSAVPSAAMRKLWRLLLAGRVKARSDDIDLFSWQRKYQREGLSTALRLELRELLSPRISLRKPLSWGQGANVLGTPPRMKQLVDWELVLAADYVHSALQELSSDAWRATLPQLLDDLQILLLDALELVRTFDEPGEESDQSYWDMPSISAHPQNRGFNDWTALIELLRDAWLETCKVDLRRAAEAACGWFARPYPTFKRLALFAASHSHIVESSHWIEWLVDDRARWLWSIETRREALELIRLKGCQLRNDEQARLEAAIMNGPPREMFHDEIAPTDWQCLSDHNIWLRLAKLRAAGVRLGSSADAKLEALAAQNPDLQLARDDRDEFSHWICGSSDPDYKRHMHSERAPTKAGELVPWLQKPQQQDLPFANDTWQETCRRHLLNSVCALHTLAGKGVWPEHRWREALQAWAHPNFTRRSWRYASAAVEALPDMVLCAVARQVAGWLKEVSGSTAISTQERFVRLCRRVLALDLDPDSGITRNGKPIDEPVAEAINHPVGHITLALLNSWFSQELNDDEGLRADLTLIFSKLSDRSVQQYRHGRVILCAHLISFFRVDRSWTEQQLLPLFGWTDNAVEARAAWEGFLWSPRLYLPLLTSLKPAFLQTAAHYAELGKHGRQFAALLTYAALEPPDGYSTADLQTAFRQLPKDGLREASQALSQAMEGAGDQREEYWKNRVHPLWRNVWPKSRDLVSSEVAERLARLAIAAGKEFPAALTAIEAWLCPIDQPSSVISLLKNAGHCRNFSAEALRLLAKIIHNQQWLAGDLPECLDDIARAVPTLEKDSRYIQLREFLRRRGG